MYDPQQNTQQDDMMRNLNPGGVGASGGSPESPMPMPAGEAPPQEEFGYEKIKQYERSMETALEAAERKDARKPNQQMPPQQQQQQQMAQPKPPSNAPKYFGYNIPPQIAGNPRLISQYAGKGDPKQSKTWVFMLLDRLLKLRTVK